MKTALIIIDMQNFFGAMMDAPLPNIKRLHARFAQHSWPIILTQHGHTPAELEPPIKNQLVRKMQSEGGVLMINIPDWELIPEIWKLAGSAPVVAKNTYDAFERTTLPSLLEEQGVDRVVICGVMTEVCCETTARSAFVKDYESWIISDACGTDSQHEHERALESARRLLFDGVMTTGAAVERLEAETADGHAKTE